MIVHRQKKKKELMARQPDGNEIITQWTKKIVIEKLKKTDVNESLVSCILDYKYNITILRCTDIYFYLHY